MGWKSTTVIVFVLFVVVGRGMDARTYNDFLSDLSVMRAFDGGWRSLLVTNRSPVKEHSIPYGAWPPAHTITQGLWHAAGLPVEYARLATGLTASLGFAFLVLLIARRFDGVDSSVCFMSALLSPFVVNFAWHGASHVLVPVGAAALLWTTCVSLESERPFSLRNVLVGFAAGLTDWFVYGAVPAMGLVAAYRYVQAGPENKARARTVFWTAFSIGIGLTVAFAGYRILHARWYNPDSASFVAGGLSQSKLMGRMLPTWEKLTQGWFYTLVRAAFAAIPVFVVAIVYRSGFRKQWASSTKLQQEILGVSILAPICFTFAFIGQCAPSNHKMQALSMILPACLIAGLLTRGKTGAAFRPAAVFAALVLVTAYGIHGYMLLPDWTLNKDTFPKLTYPLAPGDYDLSYKRPELTMRKLIKTINNQIISYPGNSERLRSVHPFYESWQDFRKYGGEIGARLEPSEVLVYFGRHMPGTNNFTGHVVRDAWNHDALNKILSRCGELGCDVALLLPQAADIRSLSQDVVNAAVVEPIPGTPYRLVRFRTNSLADSASN